MMNKKALSLPLLLAAAAIAAFALWVTTINLIEAYGDGPPYYGRTTNMDKWESPVLFLVGIDAAALILIALLTRLAIKARRSPA